MADQRYLKISQSELRKIRDLYETVMSHACHGLFYREGNILGTEVVDAAIMTPYKFFETAAEVLKDRGWVEDIKFKEDSVTVKGSIEVNKGEKTGCHRLRGIINLLYATYKNSKVYCSEVECESMGHEHCLFKLEGIGK